MLLLLLPCLLLLCSMPNKLSFMLQSIILYNIGDTCRKWELYFYSWFFFPIWNTTSHIVKHRRLNSSRSDAPHVKKDLLLLLTPSWAPIFSGNIFYIGPFGRLHGGSGTWCLVGVYFPVKSTSFSVLPEDFCNPQVSTTLFTIPFRSVKKDLPPATGDTCPKQLFGGTWICSLRKCESIS